METERNPLYKVNVKPFVVHRKDANTGCLKNHKLESGISDGGVGGRDRWSLINHELVSHFVFLKRIDGKYSDIIFLSN